MCRQKLHVTWGVLEGKQHYSLSLGHLFLPSHSPRPAGAGLEVPSPPPGLLSSGFYLLLLSAQWNRGPRPLLHRHKHRDNPSQRDKALPIPRKPLPEAGADLQTQV